MVVVHITPLPTRTPASQRTICNKIKSALSTFGERKSHYTWNNSESVWSTRLLAPIWSSLIWLTCSTWYYKSAVWVSCFHVRYTLAYLLNLSPPPTPFCCCKQITNFEHANVTFVWNCSPFCLLGPAFRERKRGIYFFQHLKSLVDLWSSGILVTKSTTLNLQVWLTLTIAYTV